MATLDTDYLIVGAGATGMAFADMLVSHTDATMVLVDRRHAPGGHWVDAYPFARLHQPSACYGVDSMPLGGYGPGPEGDPTLLERATSDQVRGYYQRVLDERLLPSGRVRFLSSSEHVGDGRVRSLVTGAETHVGFGRFVDATRFEGAIPATTPPPFDVVDGATCIPVGDLVRLSEPPDGFVVIGAGKTGQDTVLWLLERGVPPNAIRWVRPRDPWLQARRSVQPGPGVVDTMSLFSRLVEAAAAAESPGDLFARAEAHGGLHRIDPSVEATVYRGALVTDQQLADLRWIDQVIRLGYVRRVGLHEVVLDEGRVPTTPGTVHVHCAAQGLPYRSTVPIWDNDRITLQLVRYGLVPFSAALIGFVEAHRGDDADKNRLCRPMAITGTPRDILTLVLTDLDNGRRWATEPDLAGWTATSRLNLTSALPDHADDPELAAALQRFGTHAKAAADNLRSWLAA